MGTNKTKEMAILKDIFGKTLIDDPTVADFRGYDFTGRNLEYADFSNMDLSDANFSDTVLTHASFRFSCLYDCCFMDAQCRDADFEMADYFGDVFFGSDKEENYPGGPALTC